MRDDSDESLMLRYRDGDVRAFELLVTRHRKPVFNFILRFVRDTAQAEDVTQETFLRLIKGADAYERQAKFTTWLYTIARTPAGAPRTRAGGRRRARRRHSRAAARTASSYVASRYSLYGSREISILLERLAQLVERVAHAALHRVFRAADHHRDLVEL